MGKRFTCRRSRGMRRNNQLRTFLPSHAPRTANRITRRKQSHTQKPAVVQPPYGAPEPECLLGKARRVARRMRASPMSVHGRTVSGPRSLLAKSRGHGCPRDRGREGVLFFGDFLLDKQKKVTRPPGWRTKKHTDVKRLSQNRVKPKTEPAPSAPTPPLGET